MMPAPQRTGRRGALGLALFLLVSCGFDAAPPRPRHVVIVSLDTVGAKHLGAYGHPGDLTPRFDAVAARGTLFERAYTSQPHTLTAHLSLMTGLHPQVHGATLKRRATTAATTLAELLAAEGFATAAFTGGTIFTSPLFGLGRGFDEFSAMHESGVEVNAALARRIREQAREASRDPGRRLFLFVHYYDPHSDFKTPVPYESPPAFLDRYVPGDLRGELRGGTWRLIRLMRLGGPTERQSEALHAFYDASVAYTDQRLVGFLIDLLREHGLLEESLMIVTADHGEELFEHGKPLHKQLYEETVRIPLVMAGPGIPAGLRVSRTVQLVDVMPTVLSLLGLPVPPHIQGRDLTPLLRGRASDLSEAFVEPFLGSRSQGKFVWVEERGARRFAYVRAVAHRGKAFVSTGEPELYDLDADPGQQRNVAGAHPEIASRLERALLAHLRENAAAGRALADDASDEVLISEEERERLRGLGYIE